MKKADSCALIVHGITRTQQDVLELSVVSPFD
jgi:hypothetical protein